MKNIFIIGNGFDLAHGYKTDYRSFIDYLVENKKGLIVTRINDDKNNEIESHQNIKLRIKENLSRYVILKESFKYNYSLYVENTLLKIIIKDTNLNKWCDIESLYYDELIKIKDVKKLNKELNEIKNELEKYLYQFNNETNKIEEYTSFFEKVSKDGNSKDKENLVLNFNYTNTFERFYKDKMSNVEVLNFHGQLNYKINPIIFGYAATEEDTKLLIDKNDNEYLRNIKRYYYKQTQNENKLYEFLNINDKKYINSSDINVFVIGHSCGVSDRKILNDIFTNENVKNINIMYYKDYQGYFDTLVNIDRVIGKESNYAVIRNFELSLKSPQHDDIDTVNTDFKEKLDIVLKILPDIGRVNLPDTKF